MRHERNEWLRRRDEARKVVSPYPAWVTPLPTNTKSVRELKQEMRVTIWVNAAHGRQPIIDALPFEEVIKHHFVDETLVNGFSLWLGEVELYWQQLGWFQTGVTIPSGGSLEIDMKGINMELVPFVLS